MNERFRRHSLIAAVALVGVTLLAYLPSLNGQFIWDDLQYITYQSKLRGWVGLYKTWFHVTQNYEHQYYPMTTSALWLQYQLWGLKPLGYHVVNVLLHACNSILLWRVLRLLRVPGALLAGAIFALHPVHVQSVAWVTELKNTLSGFFFLASGWAFLSFEASRQAVPTPANTDAAPAAAPAPQPASRWRYALALLLFLLALLSKSATASLPLGLLLVLWARDGRITMRHLLLAAPMGLLGAGMGLLTTWLEMNFGGATGEAFSFTFVERLLILGRMLCFYTAKLLLPIQQSFIYPRWTIDAGAWWQYLFPVTALAALLLLIARRRAWGRGPVAAALFFVLAIGPMAFVNVNMTRYTFVSDHWVYWASMGLIALIAATLTRLVRWAAADRQRVQVAASLTLLAVLAGATAARSSVYRGPIELWSDTLARNPTCYLALVNRGNALRDAGEIDAAIADFQQAIAIDPSVVQAHNNLANLLSARSQTDAALYHYEQALLHDPQHASAHFNLAVLLDQLGRRDQALQHLEQALRIEPDFINARHVYATLLQEAGRLDDARNQWQLQVQLHPQRIEAHLGLARILLDLGQPDQARAALEPVRARAARNPVLLDVTARLHLLDGQWQLAAQTLSQLVALQPQNPQFRLLLARAQLQLGQSWQALDHLRQALALTAPPPGTASAPPRDPQLLQTAAWLLATSHDGAIRNGPEALALARELVNQSTDSDPVALDVLAAALAETGDFAAATEHARRALDLAPTPQRQQRLDRYRAQQPWRQNDADRLLAAEPGAPGS